VNSGLQNIQESGGRRNMRDEMSRVNVFIALVALATHNFLLYGHYDLHIIITITIAAYGLE
jgi:hypothetical protein